MSDEMGSGDAAALVAAAQNFADITVAKVSRDDGYTAHVAFAPRGRTVVDLDAMIDKRLPFPLRQCETVVVDTPDSFSGYVDRFGRDDTVLFCDAAAPALTAVIDYHGAGHGEQRFCEFIVRYDFPLTDEWRAWRDISGKDLSTVEFAEFIEEHVGSVMPPPLDFERAELPTPFSTARFADAARLIELSRELVVRADSKVAQRRNLASGEVAIEFVEEHRDAGGAPVAIPAAFRVLLPIFHGSAAANMLMRLRYRLRAGGIMWLILPHRMDDFLRTEVERVALSAADATKLPLYFGRRG